MKSSICFLLIVLGCNWSYSTKLFERVSSASFSNLARAASNSEARAFASASNLKAFPAASRASAASLFRPATCNKTCALFDSECAALVIASPATCVIRVFSLFTIRCALPLYSSSITSPITTIIQNIAPHISMENSYSLYQFENFSFLHLWSQIFSAISSPSPITPMITSQAPISASLSNEFSNAESAGVMVEMDKRENRRFHLTMIALIALAFLKIIALFLCRKPQK